MSLNQFEDFLKNKTESFSMEPSPDNWDKISSALPPEKKNRKPVFFWIPALAACLLVLIYFIESGVKSPKNTSENNEVGSILNSSDNNQNSVNIHADSSILTAKAITEISDEKATGNSISTNLIQTVSNQNVKDKHSIDKSMIRDDDSRFSKTCKRSVLNFPFLDPSVIHTNKNGEILLTDIQLKPEKDIYTIQDQTPDAGVNQKIKTSDEANTDSVSKIKTDSTQDDNIKKNNLKFYLMAEAMPHFSLTRMGIESDYKNKEPFASDYQSRKSEDAGRVNACFGIGLGTQLGKHHHISLGFRYLSISYTMNVFNVDNSVISGNPTRFSSFDYESSDSFKTMNSYTQGTPILNTPPSGSVVNRYRYIGIPIVYAYQFNLNTNWALGISAGASYNRLFRQTGIAHQKQSDIYIKSENGSVSSVTKSHIALQGGLMLSYHISNRSSLAIQFMSMRSLSPIEKDIVKTGYNSYGLGLGYKYILGNHR